MLKISFIGLGKLGLPCAEVFAAKGYNVRGYDIDLIVSDTVQVVESIQECVFESDIVFISVPTPHHQKYGGEFITSDLAPKDFDYSSVIEVIKETNKYINSKQILVLISTVLPGTIRNKLSQHATNTNLIYNPYFIAMGTVKEDMLNPDLILLGNETGEKNQAIQTLLDLYQSVVENNPSFIVCNWDESECIKVFYNTFISTKLGFVNMIQDVAEKQRYIDVDVVTDALCKSSDRIISSKYMKSGMGDGGPCHPRDNIALKYLSQKLDLGYDFFGSIIEMREMQSRNIALKLVDLSKNYDMPIAIFGKTYKPNVPYTEGSYSILIGNFCSENGIEPVFIDPLVSPLKLNRPSVVLLAHQVFSDQDLYSDIPDKSIVLDVWRSYKTNKKIKVIYYGKVNK